MCIHPLRMHGLFQPNKGNWLLGALLHWRPHSKKPFWHQASCNRVDFKTNIASYDLRYKSGQLYDRHIAKGGAMVNGDSVMLNIKANWNQYSDWFLNHQQRMCGKAVTETNVFICIFAHYQHFISCPVSSYLWQTCWPSSIKSVKKSKKRSTSCWHASCLSFFCLALHVIHHTVWCFLFFFFTFLRLPQITILLIWLLLVFKYHRKLREPKGVFFIKYVNSL